MRLPYFEEIAIFALGGFIAYTLLLDAPYTLVGETERQINRLATQIEARVPGLDIDPETATWDYTPIAQGELAAHHARSAR